MAKAPTLTVVRPASSGIAPPRKLGKPGLALWNAVQSEFRIEDIGGTELLMQACLCADRVERLTARINADGETVRSKQGVRAHPCLRDEIACRSFITRTLQRLGITDEVVRPVGRPPGGGVGWRGFDADE